MYFYKANIFKDDFLGQLSLNLNMMIKPEKDSERQFIEKFIEYIILNLNLLMSFRCGLHQLPDFMSDSSDKTKYISLFEQRRVKGWWPCIVELSDNREIAVNYINLICL